MSTAGPVPIDLWEYREHSLQRDRLDPADAELLWRHHGSRVEVRFPSPRTGQQWQLVARGWVGFLPVSPTLALRLHPKVPLENLFHMLEVAYHLKSFELLPGLADCRSLEEFYQRLASILARRVLARTRRGLHREYVGQRDRLPSVRGRIDVGRALRTPGQVRLHCHFEEHTADVEDNRLLLWTLDRIRRNGACNRPEVRRTVRTAFGRLSGVAGRQRFTAADCLGRTYSRLNHDYRALHALCRFFLDHGGPSHQAGDHRSLPFLVDMAGLFELFVAEWLREALPEPYRLTAQEKVDLDPFHRVRFEIDLVLAERAGGRTHAVVDTKYKNPDTPSTADIAQVVAYATAKGCTDALLVYPVRLDRPVDLRVGPVRVRTLAFELDGDLDAAGERFLTRLFSSGSLWRRGASPTVSAVAS